MSSGTLLGALEQPDLARGIPLQYERTAIAGPPNGCPREYMQRGHEYDRRQLGTSGTGTTGGDAPCIVFALAIGNGPADSVIPAVQNLMLAARAIGIGSMPTTLHPTVMDRFHALFQIPRDVACHFCVPLGYPQGNFGPNVGKPTSETKFLNRWGAAVPWE